MKIRNRIVAVIIKDDKLLLVRGRGYQELWTPGGKIEEGETEEETLSRELKEEVNLDLLSMKFFREYFTKSPYSDDYMVKTKCFFVDVKGNPEANGEIDLLVWISKDDFNKRKFIMLEENEKLMEDLIKEGLLK